MFINIGILAYSKCLGFLSLGKCFEHAYEFQLQYDYRLYT